MHIANRPGLGLIRSVAAGSGESALIVTGPAGIGKTTALRDAAEHAEADVAWVAISGPEANWPLSGLLVFLGAINEPKTAQLAAEVFDMPAADRFRTALLLHTRLREFALPPTLILLDDAHLLDPASRQIIGFLARRLNGTGLRLIAATSGTVDDALAGLPTVELLPLDRATSAELIAQSSPDVIQQAVLDVIVRSVDGVPAAAREVLERVSGSQLGGQDPLVLPMRVGPACRARVAELLHPLSPAGRDLLGCLSTAYAMNLSDAGRVALSAQEGIDELLNGGLIGRRGQWAWVESPIVRSAVYWGMEAGARAELHAALEAAAPADSPLALWHASFRDPGPTIARRLRDAAAEQIRVGEDAAAVESIERSILLQARDEADGEQLLRIAAALIHRGEFGLASRYVDFGEEVLSSAAARLRVVGLRVRLEYLSQQVVLVALASDALARFADDAPDEAVQLLALLAMYRAERWELDAAWDHIRQLESRQGGIAIASRVISGSARLVVGAIDGRYRRSGSLTERDLDEPTSPPVVEHSVGADGPRIDPSSGAVEATALMSRARALTFAEEYERARELFALVLGRAAFIDPLWRATTEIYSFDNDRLSGNFFGAAATAQSLLRADFVPLAHQPFRAFVDLWFSTEQGDQERAEQALERLYRLGHGRRNLSIAIRADGYRGTRHLHSGEVMQATRLLMRAKVASANVRRPQLTRIDADLVESLVRSDDLPAARKMLVDLEECVASSRSRWVQLAAARCRALVAPDEDVVASFERAIEMHRANDVDYEQARTLTAYAVRLDAMRMTSEAHHFRGMAGVLYRQIGLPQWAELIEDNDQGDRRPLKGVGPRLTIEEQKVAELVLAGRRNREIAAELFISVRSVESRLTAIYRKVGVRSRSQLVTALAG